jgi:Na+/proline symporter
MRPWRSSAVFELHFESLGPSETLFPALSGAAAPSTDAAMLTAYLLASGMSALDSDEHRALRRVGVEGR